MKFIVILLFQLLSVQAAASVNEARKIFNTSKDPHKNAHIAQELYKSKYYYSAVVFAKRHLIETSAYNDALETMIEQLILKTGTDNFTTLNDSILGKFPSPGLAFVHGIKLFKSGRYVEAKKRLALVPQDHKFSPEARLTLGAIANINNDMKAMQSEYQACIDQAGKRRKEAGDNDKLARYFEILSDTCRIHTARSLYKNGKHSEAMAEYDQIEKTSYRWPYILMERAWTAYQMEDYNRALGIGVTYKSPLLSSYFFPEAEVLSALSYYRLCLYDDALAKVEQFYKIYKPHADELKALILPKKGSHTFFLEMVLAPIKDNESKSPFIRQLLTQIRKKIIFNVDLVNYKRAINENKYVEALPNDFFGKTVKAELKRMISFRTKKLNHFVKRLMFNFVNDIHGMSHEMFNIKLEIISNKRDLVYKNQQLISDRSRGSYENVNRSIEQQFYEFRGEFWADELGDYSFGLKSNCEKVKRQAPEVTMVGIQ